MAIGSKLTSLPLSRVQMSGSLHWRLISSSFDFRSFSSCTCGASTWRLSSCPCPASLCSVRRLTFAAAQTRWLLTSFCQIITFMRWAEILLEQVIFDSSVNIFYYPTSPSYAPSESGFSFRKPVATEISQNTPNCQFTVGISQVLSKLNIFIIKSLIKGAKVKIIVPGTGSSIYYASTRPGSSAKKDHGSAAENWFVQSGLLLGLILVFAT